MDASPVIVVTEADDAQAIKVPDLQMNIARPRSARSDKTAKKAKDQSQRQGTKTGLFHETLSAEVGQRFIMDNSGLDPVNVLSRLTHSISYPNLKSPAREQPQELSLKNTEACLSSSSLSSNHSKAPKQPRFDGHTYTLDHFAALFALGSLIEQYGRISHMGILDPSYSFFMNKARTAALYYKVKSKVAVVGGDPLCDRGQWPALLAEFSHYRKKRALGIAYVGATDQFAKYATEQKGWVSMCFGRERALNPLTNKVLLEKEGKRLVTKNKQLLDPARGGMKIEVYVPSQKPDLELQAQLLAVYESWRQNRNESDRPQAYMTIFDPFALPKLMVYIYSSGPDGKPNGFAALRRVDATGGFHIDPYCALPDAPKGTSDLLIYSALALLNRAGVPYLGLGFEPSAEVSEVYGLSPSMTRIVKSAYRRTWARLPISGKKAFHDKWHADPELDAGLYIIYPDGRPDLHHSLATMHFANVSAKQVMKAEIKELFDKFNMQKEQTVEPETLGNVAKKEKSRSTSKDTSSFSSGDERHSGDIYGGIFSASKLSLQLGAGNLWHKKE